MDIMNMIFEKYGCERIAQIFKNYWVLLLLFKQLMFSLFLVEPYTAPVPATLTEENEKEVTATQLKKEELSTTDFIRIMLTLSQLNSNTAVDNDRPNQNPKLHLNESI